MVEVYPNLYVGSDADVEKAEKRNYWILACCKDGPYGHREMLGYTTLGAPKDKNYLSYQKGKTLALNLLDLDDPNFIPDEVIQKGIEFIDNHLSKDQKVLVHCNAGRSRGPSMAMMYLRHIKDLPDSFKTSMKIFKTIYHKYDPGQGMLEYAKRHWDSL